MYPEFFHIPFLHTYGVLVAAAFLAALWMAGRLAKQKHLDQEKVTNLGIYCAMAAIGGAKLMMIIVERPSDIFSLATLQAAGIFYGGLLAALAVGWWYMRRTKLPALETADVFAPAIALGHGIGRLGCFAAGCCWGIECRRPWAVTFTDPAANNLVGVPLNTPLHPTQLYEAFAEFCIFAILYRRLQSAHRPGDIISLYLVLYSAVRFVVEFFREHQQANPFGPFNTSQWISLALFAVGAAHFLRNGLMRTAPRQA